MSEFDELEQTEDCVSVSEPESVPFARLPRAVYLAQKIVQSGGMDIAVSAVVDADTHEEVKPFEGCEFRVEAASAGGKTKVLIKYDNVEVR